MMSLVEPAGILSPRLRPLTIGLLLTVTAVAFEALAVATVLPVTVRELGGLSLYGWAFSAFFLTNVVGISVWGTQADRHGPRRPYAYGLGLFGLGLVIGGLAPSMPVLVLGRAVQGMGAGALSSTLYVSIGIGYPGPAKAHMLAALSSAWVVPGLIGPAIAGLVATHASWRLVFLGLLPVLVLAGTLTLRALRQLPGPARAADESTGDGEPVPSGRFWTSVRLAAGASLLLAGLSSRHLWLLVPLVIVGATMAGPALRRLLPLGTLRADPGIPAAILSRGALTFAFFGTEAFLTLALTSTRHLSPAAAGLCLTGAATSWASGSWMQARVGGTWTRRRSGVLGASLVAAGIAITATALIASVPVAVAPLGWVIAGLGMGFTYQVGTLVVLEEAPPNQVGQLSSALQLAELISVAVATGAGGAIIGAVVRHAGTRRAGIALVDVMTVIAALVCVAVCTRLPRRATPPTHEANEIQRIAP